MPRKLHYRVDPQRLAEWDGRSRKARGPSAWSHSDSKARLTDADGERLLDGDGVHRSGAQHPVLVGTPAGRPTSEVEAVMRAGFGEEPELSSEEVDASSGRVDAMLGMLPDRLRGAVALVVIGGQTVREAALTLGVSKSEVDRRVKAGLAQLAELLESPDGARELLLPSDTPDAAPELGDYRASAEKEVELPEVGDADWNAYRQAQAKVTNGTASDADFAQMKAFERRNGLGSSFAEGWR